MGRQVADSAPAPDQTRAVTQRTDLDGFVRAQAGGLLAYEERWDLSSGTLSISAES